MKEYAEDIILEYTDTNKPVLLRIIVGQDPYPDKGKRVVISKYPVNNIVSFWQSKNNKKDGAYQRFLTLVNANLKPFHDIYRELQNLEHNNYYFFNYFSTIAKKGKRRKSQKVKILEFIEKNILDKEYCYIALIGRKARIGLKKDLIRLGIPRNNILVISHPPSNNRNAKNDWTKLSSSDKSRFQI